jgi:penicillin-binding protein 1A
VITDEERDAATAQRVRVAKRLANQHANYFVDWVDAEVRALVGEKSDDLIVQTTLDLGIQSSARTRCARWSAATRPRACSRRRWWRSTARAGCAP